MEYYYDSEEFKNTGTYKNFNNIHSGTGILKIEAYTASGAYPLSNVSIRISKELGNDTIIFFEGETNDSGIIDNIILPTRKMNEEVMDASDILYTTYDLNAKYSKYNLDKKYDVSIFDNVKVIQPITFPVNDLVDGDQSE
jgi:hypothetical protein